MSDTVQLAPAIQLPELTLHEMGALRALLCRLPPADHHT